MSTASRPDVGAFADFIESCQTQMLARLEQIDPALQAQRDPWSRSQGKGLSIALGGTGLIEKGGLNTSHVRGKKLPPAALERRPLGADQGFQALGLSVVVHPRNPFCPTAHANLHLFETAGDWWFGGGMDLTPCYPFDEDCVLWHERARQACRSLSPRPTGSTRTGATATSACPTGARAAASADSSSTISANRVSTAASPSFGPSERPFCRPTPPSSNGGATANTASASAIFNSTAAAAMSNST